MVRLQYAETTMNTFDVILPFLKPLEHLILDDSITEVMVNGPQVFVEKNGFLQEIRDVSVGERALLAAVENIAHSLGEDISELKPILNSRLPDGSRVSAVIPPFSDNGVALTIRKFRERQFETADLIPAGTFNPTLARRLEAYGVSKKNILITGAAGAGKTTLLSALERCVFAGAGGAPLKRSFFVNLERGAIRKSLLFFKPITHNKQ